MCQLTSDGCKNSSISQVIFLSSGREWFDKCRFKLSTQIKIKQQVYHVHVKHVVYIKHWKMHDPLTDTRTAARSSQNAAPKLTYAHTARRYKDTEGFNILHGTAGPRGTFCWDPCRSKPIYTGTALLLALPCSKTAGFVLQCCVISLSRLC